MRRSWRTTVAPHRWRTVALYRWRTALTGVPRVREAGAEAVSRAGLTTLFTHVSADGCTWRGGARNGRPRTR